jgi:hypothetical protein
MAAANTITPTTIGTSTRPVYSPLTTPFLPPSYCSREFDVCEVNISSCSFLLRDVTCGSDGYPSIASECFPPAIDLPGVLGWGIDVTYSPANACPYGWRTQRNGGTSDPLDSSKYAYCCPS